jgi:uncharacterized repeat protein (TIGR01451 family)
LLRLCKPQASSVHILVLRLAISYLAAGFYWRIPMMSATMGKWAKRFSGTTCRPRLELLETRTLPSVSILNNAGNGYAALHFGQIPNYVPPDTNGAAGLTNYVETVNQTIAIYSPKATGASSINTSFSNFWFTTGGLPHADAGSGLSDPVITYDDAIGRFVVADQDVNFNTHVSRFDIAVSKSGSPTTLGTADWSFYSVVTTQGGFDADYPGNFGYNHDAVVFTLNMFSTVGGAGHVQVISINNQNLLSGTLTSFQNNLNDFSVRPTTMHGSVAGDPMWLVTEHGDGLSIDVIKMTNVLSTSPTFAYTNLAVTPYSAVVHPLNPNGTAITTNIDSRIQKSSEANGVLVAAHAVSISSTQDVIQWYAVNVSGATPTLQQQGRVNAGSNTYLTYPAIDINASGNIGMTYMRSGTDTSTDYESVYVTGRITSDASGTMEASVLVPSGHGVANYSDFSAGGRAGDLSGISVDPSDNSFWAASEFANTDATANWGTAVANFNLSNPLGNADMAVTATGPSSVTAGTNATYTITITNNGPTAAQGVVLTDTLPTGSNFGSMTQTGGTDGFTLNHSGGTATETASGTINSGASDIFTLVVAAPSTLGNGAPFNDTASVSASNPDPNTSNNSATVTGSIVNNNPNADLSVAVSGPSSSTEGNTVTYTVTVTNAGPSSATSTVLTDTLGSLLNFQSATTTQGTFSASGGVVTFTIGTIASGGTVTATITAQAIEDGSTSNSASVTSSSPDPNTANNSGSVTTSVAEGSISVSGSIRVRQQTLTNFQVATFTHASGVEPTSAFSATINWGDGTSSAGTIALSGSTYTVTGSHTYSGGGRHTISTTVVEVGQAVDKIQDDSGHGKSWRKADLVQSPSSRHNQALVNSPSGSATATNVSTSSVTGPVTQAGTLSSLTGAAIEQFFAAGNQHQSNSRNDITAADSHELLDFLAQAGLLTDLGA